MIFYFFSQIVWKMEGMSRKPVSECLGSGLVVHSSLFSSEEGRNDDQVPRSQEEKYRGYGN